MKMIELDNISLKYPTVEKHVFNSITTDFEKGTINVILGNNGVGKTSLFKCMMGIIDYYKGVIKNYGDIAFISDNIDLYDYFTLEEYLDFLIKLANLNIDKIEIVKNQVKKLRLEDLMKQRIKNCSLGERYKIVLLTHIFLDHDILLIDEPLTALDVNSQQFIISFFKKMATEGKTLIISTHMMNIAFELADKINILHEGKMTQVINDFKTFEEFKLFVLQKLEIQIN